MNKSLENLIDPVATKLPDKLAVFPLNSALLLPHGRLPLQVFEPRYRNMVQDALKTKHKLIGIVQPINTNNEKPNLHKIGCAGKIVNYTEQNEDRYLILLSGICRFSITEELDDVNGYRNVRLSWDKFVDDLKRRDANEKFIDRAVLKKHLETYLDQKGLAANWEIMGHVPDSELITSLAMLCPFNSIQQQELLESQAGMPLASKLVNLLGTSKSTVKLGSSKVH